MRLQLFVIAAILTGSLDVHAQGTVQIIASGVHHGGRVVYTYEVVNGTTHPVRRFRVGHKMPTDIKGELQLTEMPAKGRTSSFWLPTDSVGRPQGWGASLVFADESGRFAIEWVEASLDRQEFPGSSSQLENAPAPNALGEPIRPGQTVGSFFVAVPRIDTAYVNGHATVAVGESLVTVPITKRDNAPPEIIATMSRLNANEGRGQWALFNLKASARDNLDPIPELVMDPVAANGALDLSDFTLEKNGNDAWNVRLKNVEGRKYTITFKARDASGNVAVRHLEYAVPPK